MYQNSEAEKPTLFNKLKKQVIPSQLSCEGMDIRSKSSFQFNVGIQNQAKYICLSKFNYDGFLIVVNPKEPGLLRGVFAEK